MPAVIVGVLSDEVHSAGSEVARNIVFITEYFFESAQNSFIHIDPLKML
jgi:hypothetical protein